MVSGISCLSSELLLAVFECLLPVPDTTLFNCMLCCKAWYPAARSVLYRDTVLSSENLIKFVNSDWSADWSIRSLTLRLNTLSATQDEIQAMTTWHEGSQAARQLWSALERLSMRIKNMENLISLSIFRNPRPPALAAFWIPHASIVSIIDNLPAKCISLEIDTQNNGDSKTSESGHICPSVRNLLPRLQYLRLRLGRICPDLCGTDYGPPHLQQVAKSYKAAHAPHLKQCTINLSLRLYTGSISSTCGISGPESSRYSERIMVQHLLAFLESGQAPALERLRILSSYPSITERDEDTHSSYEYFLRRDVHAGTSRPIAVRNIYPMLLKEGRFKRDGVLARLPVEEGGDWVSFPEVLENLAEGCAWQESERGIRLAAPVMATSPVYEALKPAVKGKDFKKQFNMNCTLWRNEEVTGQKLLPDEEGELMQTWEMSERVPEGWVRPDGGDFLVEDG